MKIITLVFLLVLEAGVVNCSSLETAISKSDPQLLLSVLAIEPLSEARLRQYRGLASAIAHEQQQTLYGFYDGADLLCFIKTGIYGALGYVTYQAGNLLISLDRLTMILKMLSAVFFVHGANCLARGLKRKARFEKLIRAFAVKEILNQVKAAQDERIGQAEK